MTERPSVLFVCVHNAGRSQMAAAYVEALGGGHVEVRSAGSAPADQVNPAAVEAMSGEFGIKYRPMSQRNAAWCCMGSRLREFVRMSHLPLGFML